MLPEDVHCYLNMTLIFQPQFNIANCHKYILNIEILIFFEASRHKHFLFGTYIKCLVYFWYIFQLSVCMIYQRRSQNEAEEAMPPPKILAKIFRWCFISISTVRKQTEQSDACSVAFSQ